MKILCEISYESEKLDEDNYPVLEKDRYFLLHFGTTYRMIDSGNGYNIPVSYSVAICQHCKTGQIHEFFPGQLRILGEDITKLKPPKQ